jgi:hypothetical protein
MSGEKSNPPRPTGRGGLIGEAMIGSTSLASLPAATQKCSSLPAKMIGRRLLRDNLKNPPPVISAAIFSFEDCSPPGERQPDISAPLDFS